MTSFVNRLAGASKCLHLRVTDEELWIMPPVLFSSVAPVFDLVHRIRKSDIVAVRERQGVMLGSRYEIEFLRSSGGRSRFEIKPTRRIEFIAALGLPVEPA